MWLRWHFYVSPLHFSALDVYDYKTRHDITIAFIGATPNLLGHKQVENQEWCLYSS